MTRKITNPARAALIAELDASIEQRLARYSKANPDLSMLNAEAWAEVQAVLDYAQRNRLTGALLPQRSRLKRLDDLEKFPALVVCKACSTFMEGGSIEQGMAFGYLLGICGGSATRWYEQLMRSGGFRLIAR